MAFLTFILQTVGISLSGVMAPGPITAVTIGKGNRSPHAGAKIAIGHGIVEFPLMIALYFGFGKLIEFWPVKTAIGIIGGAFLLWMGIGMLKSIKVSVESSHEKRSATTPKGGCSELSFGLGLKRKKVNYLALRARFPLLE